MSTNREIISALKLLREKPEFWSSSKETQEARSTAFMARLGMAEVAAKKYTFGDYIEYYNYQFRHAFMRPAMVGVGVVVLIAGGWMTSVSAATEAVPGDLLYPIKIASEQAQLSIAMSDEQRAQLHMEFASRRLAEVTALNGSDSSDKDKHIKTAVVAFKNEVAEAKNVMQNIDGGAEAAQVASALDAKADEYTSVIDQTTSELDKTSGVTQEVAEAKGDAEQAGTDAVAVLVSTVEAAPQNQVVTQDVEKSFQQNLGNIDQEVKMTLGRIAVIQHTVDAGVVKLPVGVNLVFLTSQLNHFTTQTHEAMDVMAAGGYRSAFDQLAAVQTTLDGIQQQVVALELSVVAQQDGTVDVAPID